MTRLCVVFASAVTLFFFTSLLASRARGEVDEELMQRYRELAKVQEELEFKSVSFVNNTADAKYEVPDPSERVLAKQRKLLEQAAVSTLDTLVEDENCQAAVRILYGRYVDEWFAMVTLKFMYDGLYVSEVRFARPEGVPEKQFLDDVRSSDNFKAYLEKKDTKYSCIVRNALVDALNRDGIDALKSCAPQHLGQDVLEKAWGDGTRVVERFGGKQGEMPIDWRVEMKAKRTVKDTWSGPFKPTKLDKDKLFNHAFSVECPGWLADVRYERIIRAIGKVSPAIQRIIDAGQLE